MTASIALPGLFWILFRLHTLLQDDPLRGYMYRFNSILNIVTESKKEGKDQESIQLSTIPDPEWFCLKVFLQIVQ